MLYIIFVFQRCALTKDAELKRKARAEEQEDRKAVDAERKRKARAKEKEDRKAANAERMRKAHHDVGMHAP